MAVCSPCFEQLPLAAHGLEWVQPDAPLAHPLDDGTAILLERSIDATAANLGGGRRGVAATCSRRWWRRGRGLRHDVLAPLGMPRHPLAHGAIRHAGDSPGAIAGRIAFPRSSARARCSPGIAAHSTLPLEAPLSAARRTGARRSARTPPAGRFPRGGAQRICERAGRLPARAGRRDRHRYAGDRAARCAGRDVRRDAAADAGAGRRSLPARFPRGARHAIATDRARSRWTGRSTARSRGGRRNARAPPRSTWAARWRRSREWEGELHRPAVRAAGAAHAVRLRRARRRAKHTAWAYCHVPNGSTADMTEAIEDQVERFAPGFRRADSGAQRDAAGGAGSGTIPTWWAAISMAARSTSRQFFLRPTRRLYGTPLPGVYLCSASTPPGGGVHGMCGYHAASKFLKASDKRVMDVISVALGGMQNAQATLQKTAERVAAVSRKLGFGGSEFRNGGDARRPESISNQCRGGTYRR